MLNGSLHQFVLVVLGAWLGLLSVSAAADMVQAIERIKPSIVMVGVFKKTGSPRFTLRGTGFVVGDGSIVATNAHVLPDLMDDGDASLAILVGSLPGEQRGRQARSLVVDKGHDLALLKIDGPPMPALALRDSDSVKEGQMIAFTGFPIGEVLGFAPVTHRGMVSAVTPIALPSPNARELRASVIRRIQTGSFNVFQLDATAYPGNSGGPLFDAETGEVLGVINMILVKATKEAMLTQPSGISYAIPANYLRDLLTTARQ